MKKLIALALAGVMTLTTLVGTVSAEEKMPFKDVKEKAWYYPAVKTVWEEGIMEGMTKTKFEPNIAMTRAQLVTMLYRLSGAEETGLGSTLTFTDTKKDTWYSDYIGWAVKEAIVAGYPDNTFKPDAPILRQELSKLISEYITRAELDVHEKVLAESFADADTHQKWAREYIEDLRARGIVGGDENGNFNPKSTATRAEVAMIISRIIPEEGTTPEPEPEPDSLVKVYPDNSWKDIAAPADDPTPENIGAAYTDDEIGLMISEAVRVDDNGDDSDTKVTWIGTHGGHEVKVVRTRYGTFAVFVTDDNTKGTRPDDEMSFFEITSNGCRRIFIDNFEHSQGSCVPNVLQGPDGKIYIILMNNGWSFARLTLYTYDAKTDTYTKDVQTRSFDVPGNQCHGYGYTQAVLDNHNGKIYAIFNGGDIPGYVAWFIYDMESGKWDTECFTVQFDWRIAYDNAYPDGNGGFVFVAQRCALVAELGKLLGVDFRQQTGYIWDALILVHVADPRKEEYTMKYIFEPEYSKTDTGVRGYSATNYGTGASTLDTNGNLHVVYTTSVSSKVDLRYAVYDNNLNEIRNSTLKLSKSKEYAPAIGENKNGEIFIIALDRAVRNDETTLEVWQVTDNVNVVKKVCDPQLVTVRGRDGETMGCATKVIAGGFRNGSDIDGYVPMLMYANDENGTMDYYYFCVKLPD